MEKTMGEPPEQEEIKSTAIVKYSVPKPAQFLKLKCNTDLNLPPSNWLSSSADSYGLQHVLFHQKGFSSFRMAHMFPDCVGEVDVVSDAENIKKLLKIPYCKGQVSMMVHRVENTLLLDDFDIYKHLLRRSETDWKWLRNFFFENMNREQCEEDRNVYIKNRRREALQQKSLVSKFLYHSLGNDDHRNEVLLTEKKPEPISGPKLPEAVTATPDSKLFDHDYNRNVVWTFEDIEMLLGTDLPIFGGGTHPCISLRLRDVSKPINVLTGIDYWLDNLMSNVPEVVMCYHLNGIVQKYELIKTEDLPRLDDSKFSPNLIRDVAQSILSFLKSNATKAGHTYWLFKGKDEEVVKLYDLTSLCHQSENSRQTNENPFTIPVGMLLYRVARNMKHDTSGYNGRQSGTIRMLLKNCIKLLPEEKYPEVVTSSHFMLADLFIPAGVNPEAPDFVENMQVDDEEQLFDDEDFCDDENSAGAKVLDLNDSTLQKFVNYYKSPPPISGTVEERCLNSIKHVAQGLACLKFFQTDSNANSVNREEVQQMASPFEPIPMPYSELKNSDKSVGKKSRKAKSKANKKNDKALLPKPQGDAIPASCDISWKDHLKTLLYEKSVLVYATYSEHNFRTGHYGASLKTMALLARCQLIMNKLQYTSNVLKEICLLGRAGDCCVMIVQNWGSIDAYKEQFHSSTDEDQQMIQQLERDEQAYNINIGDSYMKCIFLYDLRTIEQMLLKAVECYEQAVLERNESDGSSIWRRLGNSLNELASFYLNKAKSAKPGDDLVDVCCKKAEPYFQRALQVFEQAKDDANVALIYMNLGHMHRLLAYWHTPDDRGPLTAKEQFQYNKAFLHYKKALQVLGDRKYCSGVWDAVTWELSTAFFNMGCILHENPPPNLTKSEAEKQVVETLQKALQYCDLSENNPKLPLYQFRAAVIHYRMASLYHSHLCTYNPTDSTNSNNRKNPVIQLAKINYEKASKYYLEAGDVVSYLTSQMQRVALFEYLSEGTSNPIHKIKNLHHCMEVFMEINQLIQLLVDKKLDFNPNEDVEEKGGGDKASDSFKTCFSLLNLIRQRLQYVLKMLVKLCLSKPPPFKDCPKLANLYKSCYLLSLKLKDDATHDDLLKQLNEVLKDIQLKSEKVDHVFE